MLYRFTYYFNNKLRHHTCRNSKEADFFFNLLLNLCCDSIRVDTIIKY